MPLPKFKDSTKAGDYRRAQIKKYIEQIQKNRTRIPNTSPVSVELQENVEQLLTEVVKFRKSSLPGKVARDDMNSHLAEIAQQKKDLNDAIASLNPDDPASHFVRSALDYASKSVEYRLQHLTKVGFLTETEAINATKGKANKKNDKEDHYLALPLNANRSPQVSYKSPAEYSGFTPQIALQDTFTLGEQIGQGNSGKVYKINANYAKENEIITQAEQDIISKLGGTSADIVIKIPKHQDEKTQMDLKKEAKIGDMLRAAALYGGEGAEFVNLSTLASIKIDGREQYVIASVLETGGGLTDYLTGHCASASASEKVDILERIFFQQKQGLKFLHSNNILHRDLAMRNFLVSADGTVKISDFGMSEEVGAHPDSVVTHNIRTGPQKWLDLESIIHGQTRRSGDDTSLKITFLEEFAALISGNSSSPGNPMAIWPPEFGQRHFAVFLHKHPGIQDQGYLQVLSNYLQTEIIDKFPDADRQIYSDYLQKLCERENIPAPMPASQLVAFNDQLQVYYAEVRVQARQFEVMQREKERAELKQEQTQTGNEHSRNTTSSHAQVQIRMQQETNNNVPQTKRPPPPPVPKPPEQTTMTPVSGKTMFQEGMKYFKQFEEQAKQQATQQAKQQATQQATQKQTKKPQPAIERPKLR